MRKHIFGVSYQVRHKPGCTATKNGLGLEIRNWEEEQLYYLCSENKSVDQLRGYDLRLCYRICKKEVTRLIFNFGGLKYKIIVYKFNYIQHISS